MDQRIETYINEVLQHMVLDEKNKKRIRDDLYLHISSASASENLNTVLERMGPPDAVAREFMENIYEDKDEIIKKLIQDKVQMENQLKRNGLFEYQSKTRIFGLPLVHVKLRLTRSWFNFGLNMGRPTLAKGIIAIGNFSAGVVSISIVPIGLISFGAFPVGLLAFGGISVGALAVGGIAVGLLAIGGIAVGLGAMGGIAIGKIAVGGYAKGTVAIGGKAVGDYVINAPSNANSGITGNGYTLGHVPKEQVESVIRKAYPHISKWLINLFSWFAK